MWNAFSWDSEWTSLGQSYKSSAGTGDVPSGSGSFDSSSSSSSSSSPGSSGSSDQIPQDSYPETGSATVSSSNMPTASSDTPSLGSPSGGGTTETVQQAAQGTEIAHKISGRTVKFCGSTVVGVLTVLLASLMLPGNEDRWSLMFDAIIKTLCTLRCVVSISIMFGAFSRACLMLLDYYTNHSTSLASMLRH